MIEKLTGFTDYFRKIPVAFLIAFTSVLGLILFLPNDIAIKLAVQSFREEYAIYLGPTFLLSCAFLVARIYMFIRDIFIAKKKTKNRILYLYSLTPEEKGYLIPFIKDERKNSLE